MNTKKSQKRPRGKARVEEDENVFVKLHDWHEEVSRTSFDTYEGNEYECKLDAYGFGEPPLILKISVKGMPARDLEMGIDKECLELLATWLVECLFSLDSLRHEKAQDTLRAEIQIINTRRREWYQQWSKKFEDILT